MSNLLSCGKCPLQHFLPCGDPAHVAFFREAVAFYLGRTVETIYAGFIGDPQAAIWATYYEGPRSNIIEFRKAA